MGFMASFMAKGVDGRIDDRRRLEGPRSLNDQPQRHAVPFRRRQGRVAENCALSAPPGPAGGLTGGRLPPQT
jgi:hypothetical protein